MGLLMRSLTLLIAPSLLTSQSHSHVSFILLKQDSLYFKMFTYKKKKKKLDVLL